MMTDDNHWLFMSQSLRGDQVKLVWVRNCFVDGELFIVIRSIAGVVAFWMLFTIIDWLTGHSVGETKSLLDVLKDQWLFIKSLKLY